MGESIIPARIDPRTLRSLTFGNDRRADTLYGSLRVDNPNGFPFECERRIELVAQSGNEAALSIPHSMRIALPRKRRLGNMLSVEPVRGRLDALRYVTLRAGWNQTDQDLMRIARLDPKSVFIAYLLSGKSRIPVGSGVSAPLGDHHAWIGLVTVVPELRRYGIANEIMISCLSRALDDGRIINGLDATPLGHTVYGALGYADAYRLWRSSFATADHAGFTDASVTRALPADLNDIIAYDAPRFLERREILRVLYRDAIAAFTARENGRITGYVFARPGRMAPFVGPLIADDTDTAQRLARACAAKLNSLGHAQAFMDTPEAQFEEAAPAAGDERPKRHRLLPGLVPLRSFVRMYHLVDTNAARTLSDAYCEKESLKASSPQARRMKSLLDRGVMNHALTRAFMEYERGVLLPRIGAISGAEKG